MTFCFWAISNKRAVGLSKEADWRWRSQSKLSRWTICPPPPADCAAATARPFTCQRIFWQNFYRAMHFSAKRGIAIACRLSVCLSVRPSVRLSVTLVDCDHIGWNSSKLISPLVSLRCLLFATPTWRVCSKGNTPKFGPTVTHPCWFECRRYSIANCGRMVTDSATVTMENL